jgi:hypothetical protein
MWITRGWNDNLRASSEVEWEEGIGRTGIRKTLLKNKAKAEKVKVTRGIEEEAASGK